MPRIGNWQIESVAAIAVRPVARMRLRQGRADSEIAAEKIIGGENQGRLGLAVEIEAQGALFVFVGSQPEAHDAARAIGIEHDLLGATLEGFGADELVLITVCEPAGFVRFFCAAVITAGLAAREFRLRPAGDRAKVGHFLQQRIQCDIGTEMPRCKHCQS